MKFINNILNFIFLGIVIILLYLYFPSFNSYINNLENKIDTNKDLLVDKITENQTLKKIGNLVKDAYISKDYGYTGDELDFPAEYYPYYNNLDENQKKLYKQIYANSVNLIKDFTPIVDIELDDITIVIESVMYDHPELFYLDNSYSYKYDSHNKCVQINLIFNDLANNYVYNKEMFEYNVDLIVEEANKYNNDLDKEKYVHDKLVNNLNYDTNSLYNQSAYSAIINRNSVCAGYSKAFQYIMQKLNIPCFYVTGYSDGDHAWNIVKIGEYYYNVDLTWDNTGNNVYKYFNKNDEDFSSTHSRSEISSNLPNCLGTSYNKKNNINDFLNNIENFIIDFRVNN